MTYVVTENCINCKYQDCVTVCPVDCFYEGENFLVIHPEECIDCGVCEPECPADAIRADTEPGLESWLAINAKYAGIWPNITEIGTVPPDAETWNGKSGKAGLLITGEAPPQPHAQKPIYDPGEVPGDADVEHYEVDGTTVPFPKAKDPAKIVRLDPLNTEEPDGFEVDGLRVNN